MPFFVRDKRKAIQQPRGKNVNPIKSKVKRKSTKNNEEIDSGSDDDGINLHAAKRSKEFESDEEIIETAQEKRLRLAKQYIEDIKQQELENSSGSDSEDDTVSRRLKQDVLEQRGKINKQVANKYVCPTSDDIRVFRGHQLTLTCTVISSDDLYIYSSSKDCSIHKYSVESGKKELIIHGGRKGTDNKHIGHTSHVLALAITSDNKFLGLAFRNTTHQLFSCSEDKTVKIWNVLEKNYIETLYGHQDCITAIDCLNRERAITTGGRDLSVRIWKILEESQLVFNGHSGSIDCVSLINEQHFITGADDNSIAVWGIMKKKPLVVVKQAHCGDNTTTDAGTTHNHWITAVASLQFTDLVATGSNDGFIRFWQCNDDFRHIKPLFRLAVKGFVNSLKFSSSGKFIVAGIGQEHRLGRWWTDKSAKNSVIVINLPQKTE